ncbi:hypothetical protein AAHB56_30875 [Bacillus thuringiensis]
MAVYAVTYDLHKPGQDYEKLHDQLKSYQNYSKRFESFWLIDASQSASEIRDDLQRSLTKTIKFLLLK